MVTKNFLFGLALSILLLTGCDTLRVKTQGHGRPETPPTQQTVEVGETGQVHAEAPEFLKKDQPKLGIILGGGGVLSFAHIGFLQELETQKIPVHSIGGIEWGALVAGAYAMEKKAHSVEWNMLKIPIDQFDNSGFFSSGKKSVGVSSFDGFLETVFGNKSFSELACPFTCPFVNVAKEKTGVRQSGRLRNAIRSCWALPPHFKVDSVGANPLGVAEVAHQLRQSGAEVIVYVDVISKNDLISEKQRLEDGSTSLLWVAQKSLPALLKPPIVDQVIEISIGSDHMTSYKSLRSIVRKGQLKSKSLVKGLATQYAY